MLAPYPEGYAACPLCGAAPDAPCVTVEGLPERVGVVRMKPHLVRPRGCAA